MLRNSELHNSKSEIVRSEFFIPQRQPKWLHNFQFPFYNTRGFFFGRKETGVKFMEIGSLARVKKEREQESDDYRRKSEE